MNESSCWDENFKRKLSETDVLDDDKILEANG